MDEVIIDILHALRERGTLSPAELDRIIRAHSKRAHDGRRVFAKKRILPYYLQVKADGDATWKSWNVDEELDRAFVRTLRMKPRRTASGVATITVITKPWTCANNCIYCPCDVRMPKSYLHDEPACQRAERNWFDPYLQMAARLRTLRQMGHPTDKVEVIVLGGSWTDYPESYRLWYVRELFCALDDDDDVRTATADERRARYRSCGIACEPDEVERYTQAEQHLVAGGARSFNDAVARLYGQESPWEAVSQFQHATWEDVERAQAENERAAHRVVGLVVETRPDALDCAALTSLRRLGCTKVQMGVQSLDARILAANGRAPSTAPVERAFALARLFGFKLHAHYMLNLLGADPEGDKQSYRRFATDPRFSPDEVKLYPCALVDGTELRKRYDEGLWRPYSESELLDVLAADMLATPAFMRVSRMIRDISAKDIMVGNKKTNLRQMVESHLAPDADRVREIRFREISTDDVSVDELSLEEISYETTVTSERFLQWVTPAGKIAGFLRLSLPLPGAIETLGENVPVAEGQAMIREVHVYGTTAQIHAQDASAQHRGLGRALVERACAIARDSGYEQINVISAVGTRDYYRKLGFADAGLYQRRALR